MPVDHSRVVSRLRHGGPCTAPPVSRRNCALVPRAGMPTSTATTPRQPKERLLSTTSNGREAHITFRPGGRRVVRCSCPGRLGTTAACGKASPTRLAVVAGELHELVRRLPMFAPDTEWVVEPFAGVPDRHLGGTSKASRLRYAGTPPSAVESPLFGPVADTQWHGGTPASPPGDSSWTEATLP